MNKNRIKTFFHEFLLFGFKQAYACLFGGILLFFILATHFYYPLASLHRYDFLCIIAILTQILLFAFRLETPAEAKVILLFHITGTVMEIFKVHYGAWIYPEEGFLKIMNVPLFSGFMYSAVGSYIARSWKIFKFSFSNFPDIRILSALSILIYINFFAHHFLPDIRLLLFVAVFFLFWKSWVFFTVDKTPRKMPTLLAAFLLSLFIWFAENIGTFAHAWQYPEQYHMWQIVSFQKLGSWFLLMIISFVMVCWLYMRKDDSNKKT